MLMLGFEAIPQQEIELIEAAIEAGVTYILPTEFGADNANTELANMVPINAAKTAVRTRVEELGKKTGAGWIGVSNNAWFDYVSSHIIERISSSAISSSSFILKTISTQPTQRLTAT